MSHAISHVAFPYFVHQLADGNSVSEAAISSMPTVRAFDAAKTEMKEFETFMKRYLDLNFKAAAAYSG